VSGLSKHTSGRKPLFSLAGLLAELARPSTQIAEIMALDLDRVRQIAERVAG